jgi:hypothetical protein
MDNNYKKTGRDGVGRATRKGSCNLDANSIRARVAAAIGRAAIWGLLPIPLAGRLIRWARSA